MGRYESWVLIAFASTVAGCASDSESLDDSAESESALGNASRTMPAWLDADGVVRYQLWVGDTWLETCSGQVIARNAILTAAHCLRDRGFDDYSQRVAIRAYRQRRDGAWSTVTQNGADSWSWSWAFIHPDHIDRQGYNDLAVIRTDSNLTSLVASDAASLHDEDDREISRGYVFGYGYHTDNAVDHQLRWGDVEDLEYSETYIRATLGPGDTHLCAGDSGGPLKMSASDASVDSMVFGVAMGGNGSAHCFESRGQWGRVGGFADWIASTLTTPCVRKTHTQGFVNALHCW